MQFVLREWRDSDTASTARYANNQKIAANLRNVFPYPYTLNDAQAYITACLQSDPYNQCFRAIDVEGQAAGSIGVFRKDDIYCKSAEIGYWLGEPYWGKGIITSAILQICEYCFAQWDIVRIFAEPFAYNTGSRRALEKAGFKLEGLLQKSVYKYGQFHDSCIYAKLAENK